MTTHYHVTIRNAIACSFLLVTASLQVSAQKSIYDVVPGSGPQKKKTAESTKPKTLPGVINGPGNDKTVVHYPKKERREVCYNKKRRWLPPGQAKKVYGGRAKDYAHGRYKKNKHHKKHHHKHKHHHDEKHEWKND